MPARSPDPAVRWLSAQVRTLLAPNPGPMTLAGTNTYLLAGPGATGAVVVDPGPDDVDHLRRLRQSAGRVDLVLLTHRHADHVAGAAALSAATGAPVRAALLELCQGAGALLPGEVIAVAGVRLTVLPTPGHTSDSVCFELPDSGGGAVLTGDTVLGAGTTVIDHPDGRLVDYLASLELLRGLGRRTVLPGHGPVLPDLAAVCADYLDHRRQRLDAVRSVLARLGADASVSQVADSVYSETSADLRSAAELSVAAQLAFVRGRTEQS